MTGFLRTSFFAAIFIFCGLFFGCKTQDNSPDTFIIWTDREEFVSYSELFNSIQDKTKAIIVYKKRLASSLPPAKDEEKPDLIAGSWLKNDSTRKLFRPLDSLLSKDSIDVSTLYAPLVEYGKIFGSQYLLPVSFNLPLFVFSSKNEDKIPNQHSLSLEQIKELAGDFNAVNKKGFYTKMGFAPSWDDEFLYEVAKKFGPCFKQKGNGFVWDEKKLSEAVKYIRAWTAEKNSSTTAEQDFEFKYLYTPKYRQIAEGRTLFSYITSSDLFKISFEQLGEVDFRWLSINGSIPAKDDIVSMAIYKHAKNPKQAENFIRWFFQEKNQKLLLERSAKMHLDTATFGIVSGFSTIKGVNERIFPTFYRNLLGNLPAEEKIAAPQAFPPRWQSIKERVIFPYLNNAIKTDSDKKNLTMESLLNTWSKQFD